jgi:hypothetical protein
VYSRTASGNAVPLRTISGLNGPHEIAMPENTGGYCAAQYACASVGCMPQGSVDCQNGYYCEAGTVCTEGTEGGAGCRIVGDAGIDAGVRTVCSSGAACSDGSCCAAGYDCVCIGCMPTGSTDCCNPMYAELDGYYCPAGTICASSANGDVVCNKPPKCEYTYSNWSACGSDNTETRTVISSSPADCVGTPALSKGCGGGGGNCGSFTEQQCCAGGAGISAVSCAVDNTYIQACGCPAGTRNGGADSPTLTWCICP